jgi:hypothetical protein
MKQPYKIINLRFFYFQGSQTEDNNFSFAGAPAGAWDPLFIVSEEKNVLIKKITGSWVTQTSGLSPDLRAIKYFKVLYRLLDKIDVPLATVPGLIQNSNSGAFIQPAGQIDKLTSINSYKPYNDFVPGIIAGGIQLTYLEWQFFDSVISSALEYELRLQIYYQDID